MQKSIGLNFHGAGEMKLAVNFEHIPEAGANWLANSCVFDFSASDSSESELIIGRLGLRAGVGIPAKWETTFGWLC